MARRSKGTVQITGLNRCRRRNRKTGTSQDFAQDMEQMCRPVSQGSESETGTFCSAERTGNFSGADWTEIHLDRTMQLYLNRVDLEIEKLQRRTGGKEKDQRMAWSDVRNFSGCDSDLTREEA